MLRVGRRNGKKKVAIVIAVLLIAFCVGVYFIRFYKAKNTEYEHFSESATAIPELTSEVYQIEGRIYKRNITFNNI